MRTSEAIDLGEKVLSLQGGDALFGMINQLQSCSAMRLLLPPSMIRRL